MNGLAALALCTNLCWFDIPANESAPRALIQWYFQSDVDVLYIWNDVADVHTHAVYGYFSPLGALDVMLLGTPLFYETGHWNGVVIQRRVFPREHGRRHPLPPWPWVPQHPAVVPPGPL